MYILAVNLFDIEMNKKFYRYLKDYYRYSDGTFHIYEIPDRLYNHVCQDIENAKSYIIFNEGRWYTSLGNYDCHKKFGTKALKIVADFYNGDKHIRERIKYKIDNG